MADREGWWPEGEPSGRKEDPAGGDEPAGEGSGGDDPWRRPPRGLASRDRPRVASRYSLFVGLAFIVLAGVAIVNAISTDEGGILGAGELDQGRPLAEFALPDVRGPLDGDANLAQDDCAAGRNPCPEGDRRSPACEIDSEGAIRACDLFDRPLAISFWFTRGGDCMPTQVAFDRVAGRFAGEVNFLSVNVRDSRERVEEIVETSGWSVPVGHDADGLLSNVFGVGVCPTIVLAYPGGILHQAAIRPGNFEPEELDRLVRELIRESEARERIG
jgi:hypothetical protein